MTTEIETKECTRCWGSGRLAARNAPCGSVLCPNCGGKGTITSKPKVAPIVAAAPIIPTPVAPASYRCHRCGRSLSATMAMAGTFGTVCADCFDREEN